MHHDSAKRQVVLDRVIEVRQTVALWPMENAIFGLLWAQRGAVVATCDLLDAMDATNPATTHTAFDLRVYIHHLRRKLGGDVTIKTHPKNGYSIA